MAPSQGDADSSASASDDAGAGSQTETGAPSASGRAPRGGVFKGAGLRIVSALLMAPAAAGAVWLGGWAFDGLIVAAAALMAYEWARLADGGRLRAPGLALCALAPALAGLAAVAQAFAAATLVAALAVAPLYLLARRRGVAAPGLLALGGLAVAAPCLSLEWLRHLPEIGRPICYYVMLAVWATDTGAYIFGRLIGGPKLAPRISPNKTWAGLLGGMGCAGLVGAATAWAAPAVGAPLWAGLCAAALAVVAQGGDLAESAFKRHMGVKDSGGLIPGHGGLLDRVDGLMTAAPLTALALLALRF